MSVINFNKKIIFVHIPKTAGTSIEKVIGGEGHYSITEITNYINKYMIGVDINKFFKFSIVRNPFDRLVSFYATFVSQDMSKFNNWILYHENATPFKSQVSFLCDEDKNLKVDFVGRFENLQSDWKEICNRIGKQAELPHIKTGKILLDKPYKQYYIPETKKLIHDWLRDDFVVFGYED